MKISSFISLFVALHSSVALSQKIVPGQDIAGGTQGIVGGVTGNIYHFECPTGAITMIRGKASNIINQIQFGCSDSTRSEIYGGQGGTDFKLPFIENGIPSIAVVYGNQINAVAYNYASVGGGGASLKHFQDPSGDNCPMVAVTLRADDNCINALEFIFQCRPGVTRVITRSQFDNVANDMKTQYQTAALNIRQQYITILTAFQQRVQQLQGGAASIAAPQQVSAGQAAPQTGLSAPQPTSVAPRSLNIVPSGSPGSLEEIPEGNTVSNSTSTSAPSNSQ